MDEAASRTVSDLMDPGSGSILCTSRHSDVGRLGTKLDVGSLSEDEGLDLLLYRSHHERADDNVKEGTAIVQKLGCLALAIDQAGAYIDFRHLPLANFLDHYEKRKKTILNHTPKSLWEYRRTLGDAKDQTSLSTFTTWEMSFQQIASDEIEKRNIGHFLTLVAFLNPAKISEDLFTRHFSSNSPTPEWMEWFCTNGDWNSDKYQDTVCGLFNLSLIQSIEFTGNQISFSIHPLVRNWLQLRQAPEDLQRCSIEVLELLENILLVLDKPDSLNYSVMRTHIGFWLESEEALSQSHSTEPPEGWRVERPNVPEHLHLLVCYSIVGFQLKHELAERLALRSLDGCRKYLGPNHCETMKALMSLGGVHQAQKRYVDAKAMYDKAMEVCEATGDSRYRPKIMDDLADLSEEQGDDDTTAQLRFLTFKYHQLALGDFNSYTITAAIQAGEFCLMVQDFVTAAILMEGAAWVLGDSPGQHQNRVGGIGRYYMRRNKLVEAERLFTFVVKDVQSTLEEQSALELLGEVCIKKCRYAEAENYLQQAQKAMTWYTTLLISKPL